MLRPNRAELNLAAQLTPPGVGGLAVVRLRGPLVAEFCAAHFSRPPKPLRCVHTELGIRRGDGTFELIDDPVAVLLDDGMTLDLSLHGGVWIVEKTLAVAEQFGFERTSSDDLALADGRTVLEREVNAALALAQTDLGVETLLKQPALWRAALTRAEQMDWPAVLADRALHYLLHPPAVAIIGSANAGKSSLANRLFGRERSIVAPVAGTTRDHVADAAQLDGLPIELIDTPGVRADAGAFEQAAFAHSADTLAAADLILLLVDHTQPIEPEQRELAARYPHAVPVRGKSDLIGRQVDPASPFADAISISSMTGAGMDELKRFIVARFIVPGRDAFPRCWTQRQRRLLGRGLEYAAPLTDVLREICSAEHR